MTSQERLAIVVVGTLAIHLAIATGLAIADRPERLVLLFPAREIELVDLVVEKPRPPEPLPEPEPEPEAEPEPEPEPEPEQAPPPPKVARTAPPPPVRTGEPPPAVTTTESPDPDPGPGAPVLRMENLGEGTEGVAVVPGKTTKGRKGAGGVGTGAGTGTGTGTGTGAAPPMSVATIKTRAKPKDGFDYFDAGKRYPAEARQLGVEGQIRVRLVVDTRGKVSETRLLNKLGHGLDELALERARLLEFHPAVDTDDRPVSSIVVWTFTFAID